MRPSLISERNDFSKSASPCPLDPPPPPPHPHQISAQSDLRFTRRCRGGHLGYRNGTILAILNFRVTLMPPIKFWLNPTYGSGGDVVWRISRWPHLGYQNRMILAILNLCVTAMPPIKFQLNPTYALGGDVVKRISRWPPRRPPWISERNDFSNSESPCCHNASN